MPESTTESPVTSAQSATRRTVDPLLIKSLTPRGGPAVDVSAITAFVGPNNSGTTETLRDVLRLMANFEPRATDRSQEEEPQPLVLQDLTFAPKLTVERIMQGLTVVDSQASAGAIVHGLGPDLKTPVRRTISRELQNILYRPIMNAKSVWTSSLGELMRLRVAYVGPDDRQRLVAPTPAGSPLQAPENLLQMLQDADASIHAALDAAFTAAFEGWHVQLDASERIQLTLRVAREFPSAVPHLIDNARQLQNLRRLDEEGDAYQSFVAIVLTMLLNQGRVILLDQPESFLHPQQARVLGRWIGQQASPLACQVFIATRDAALLEGLAEGSADMTIVRMERVDSLTRFRGISRETVKTLARFPLFAAQDALRLLFCDGVVVVPESADRVVYETVATRGAPTTNIEFIEAMGARNVALVTKVVKQCGLPVCSVVELDLLRNEKELIELVQAASGSPPPQPWLATRERLATHVEGWFDPKSLKASANEVESFLDQIKSGGGALSTTAAQSVASNGAGNWEKLRYERLEWLPHELRIWVEELLEDLKRLGIHVSPRGRLEAWLDAGAEPRGLWLNKAIQTLHQGQCPTELRAFVAGLLTHLSSATNPTRSTRLSHRT